MHGTKHLSNIKERLRAISPGRMSENPGRNFEKWERDNTTYFHLTRNDIYTLATPDAWLEDNIIHFWTEYLEHEELSKFPKANIRFVDPNSASWMKNAAADDLNTMFKSSDYYQDKVTHLFIPVNDDRVADHDYAGWGTPKGNHWSLLVVSLIDNVAFHYDSMRGANHEDAQNMVAKIQTALPIRRTLRFVPMGVEDAPQQSDGSNCGTFVCIVMKHLLLKRLLKADANQKVTMSMRVRSRLNVLGNDHRVNPNRESRLTSWMNLGMKGQDIDYERARKMMLALIEDRRKYAIDNGKVNSSNQPMID